MQTQNKMFEDFARLMTSAAGVAQDAKKEFEIALNGMFERMMAKNDLVTREEFEAVRTMAIKAREENEALTQRITELEKQNQDDESE